MGWSPSSTRLTINFGRPSEATQGRITASTWREPVIGNSTSPVTESWSPLCGCARTFFSGRVPKGVGMPNPLKCSDAMDVRNSCDNWMVTSPGELSTCGGGTFGSGASKTRPNSSRITPSSTPGTKPVSTAQSVLVSMSLSHFFTTFITAFIRASTRLSAYYAMRQFLCGDYIMPLCPEDATQVTLEGSSKEKATLGAMPRVAFSLDAISCQFDALHQHAHCFFQQAFHFLEEARGGGAIDGTMIDGDRHLHAVAHDHLSIDH